MPFILLIERLLPILIPEVVYNVEEGLMLPQQFLALTPALDGTPRCDKDRHLLKELIFPVY